VSVRVKICGVTRVADAEYAITLGADIIGLNFYPPSPRALSLERARELRAAIGDRCQVAGVFVNAERSYIAERLDALRLDWLQFHGDEPDDALRGWPVKVIRALRLRAAAATPAALARGSADYVLVDTFHPGLFGGTGQAQPLSGLEAANLSRVFLSGGLTADNVAAAVALAPFGVDVASGVESAPGIKDAGKLRSFIANAKSAR
jgi:phosphoribosylanthranilate isomerase